jgi:hypothetical protein
MCLLGEPAHAAVEVDFTADGLRSQIVLPRGPETSIVVRLSGTAPQVLKLHDRIIAIVATDIDHDGEIDLSALSERRGVFIWLNKGGDGRLKAVKRKHHKRGFTLSTGGPLASPRGSSTDDQTPPGTQDDRDRLARHERLALHINQTASIEPACSIFSAVPAGPNGASPSRAPPVLTTCR